MFGGLDDLIDRIECGINWTVSQSDCLEFLIIFLQADSAGRCCEIARACLEPVEHITVFIRFLDQVRGVMRDNGFKIRVGNVLFLVADVFEFLKAAVDLFFGQCIPEFFDALRESVASGMFSKNQIVGNYTDSFRRHDLIGFLVGKDAMLMDTGFMDKSIFPNDRLVQRSRLSDDVVNGLA